MSLKAINREELKDVLNALEEAFLACDIDYYLIGAIAKDVWYARGDKKFRTTKDIDFAILVGSHAQYELVHNYLTTQKGYVSSTTNAFVVIAPDKTAVDLLPFGEVAIDDGVEIIGEGLTSIKVNGFMEVYETGTKEVEMMDGHHFAVATLPAIVLLKFIAYDDRPEHRIKDARDIANIIAHFFDLEGDMIYEHHSDLFLAETDLELDEVSAIVIGREIYAILKGNHPLCERLMRILNSHLEKGERSDFIRNMAQETNTTIEHMIRYLKGIQSGFSAKMTPSDENK